MRLSSQHLFFSPYSGQVIIPHKQVLLGNEFNQSIPSPTILLDNLPDLPKSNIWLGVPQSSGNARPQPVDLTPIFDAVSSYPSLTKIVIANPTDPDESRYVTFAQAQVNEDYAYGKEPYVVLGQCGEKSLPNAQALNTLYNPLTTPNILKLSLLPPDPLDPEKLPFGQFEIALPGFDFLTLAQLEEAEAVIFANIATSLVGAISAQVITPDPTHPEIKKIETTFQDNAVFPGSASISIPQGTTLQRPLDEATLSGMIRYNSDTDYFEGAYKKSDTEHVWDVFYGAGKPTHITDTFGISDNLYIGTQAGVFNNLFHPQKNTVIGLNAFCAPDLASIGDEPVENVVIGYNAMQTCATILGSARYSVAIGRSSQEMAAGDFNVSVGYQALQYCGFVKNSVAIGARAMSKSGLSQSVMSALSPGGENVAVGADSLGNIYSGSDNVAIGSGALQYATNVSLSGIPSGYIDGSVAIGFQALQGIEDEQYQIVTDGSVAIGHQALNYYSPFTSSPLGKPCIAIGYAALRQSRGGSSNLAIGYEASLFLNSDILLPTNSESRHIAIGDMASRNFTTSPSFRRQHPNLALGVEALGNNSCGRGNVAIGDSALKNIEGDSTPLIGQGGDFNTALGYEADTEGGDAATLTNAIAIGAYAKVGTSNTLVLGGQYADDYVYYPNIGIANNNPHYSLHIKNTQQVGQAIIALAETANIPSFESGHLYFYAQNGEAYFKSDKAGSNKIGTLSSIQGTPHEIDIDNSIPNSPVISIAKNPIFQGQYIQLPVVDSSALPSASTCAGAICVTND